MAPPNVATGEPVGIVSRLERGSRHWETTPYMPRELLREVSQEKDPERLGTLFTQGLPCRSSGECKLQSSNFLKNPTGNDHKTKEFGKAIIYYP